MNDTIYEHIIKCNYNGLYIRLRDLQLITLKYNPISIAIQETHKKSNQIIKFNKYVQCHSKISKTC